LPGGKARQGGAVADIPPEFVVEELERRAAFGRVRKRLRSSLIPGIQRDIFDDKSKQIVALHVRGGGKTWALLSRALACALDGGDVAYIAKTYQSVEDIAWDTLKRICRGHGIEVLTNENKLRARVSGRGRICFFGADNRKFKDQLRGSRWNLIIVDEAAHFYSDLSVLVRDVLVGCTFGRSGTIILTGTPFYIAKGMFFELTKPGAPTHGWSRHECHDPFYNPYSREDVERSMQLLRDEYGPGWDKMPFVRREMFAEWTHDTTALVYKYDQRRNSFKVYKPQIGDTHILGLDFSFTGNTALVEVVVNPDKHRAMFVLNTISMEGVGLDQIDRLGPYLRDFHSRTGGGDIVFDYSQTFIQEALSATYPELNFIRAQKTEKYTHIELFNADLQSSRILIRPETNEKLLNEWAHGTWKRNPDGSTPVGMPKQNPKDKWDCSDACLYAWRWARVRDYEGKEQKPPAEGSREWFEMMDAKMRRAARRAVLQGDYYL